MIDMYFEDSHYPRVSVNQTGPVYDVSRIIILSEMLYRCYGDDTVHFTDGILRLKDLIPHIRRPAVVFIDTVPDNFYTLRDYEDILRYVIDKSFYDLYIIPIPCIEYFAIKCFGKDCPSKRTVINRLDYSEDIIAKSNMSLRNRSFERFCKAVMSVIVPGKYLGTVDIQAFNISSADCTKLLQALPYHSQQTLSITDNLIAVIKEQFDLLLAHYVRYEERLSKSYDIQRLTKFFNQYVEGLNRSTVCSNSSHCGNVENDQIRNLVYSELLSIGYPELTDDILSVLPKHDLDISTLHCCIQSYLSIKGII